PGQDREGFITGRLDLEFVFFQGPIAWNSNIELPKRIGPYRRNGNQVYGRIGDRLATRGQDGPMKRLIAVHPAIQGRGQCWTYYADNEGGEGSFEDAVDDEACASGRRFPGSRPH